VTGVVVGAAVGLGVTFSESILFIALIGSLGSITGTTGGFEYWIRQVVTLFGGHLAFGAVLGAAVAMAWTAPDRRSRVRIVGLGLLAALGGTVANEALTAGLSALVHGPVTVGGVLDTWLVSPLILVLVQGPFVVTYLLLLWSGLRARVAAAREAVVAEAARAGDSLITGGEVAYLTDPRLRWWSLAGTWRTRGLSATRAVWRVQEGQLALAALGWQQSLAAAGQAPPLGPGEDEALRADVRERKMKAALVADGRTR
jgi:hypothetical protein